MLKCVAAYCSVLQRVAVRCSVLQCLICELQCVVVSLRELRSGGRRMVQCVEV